MKIAAKISMTALTTVFGLSLGATQVAFAQQAQPTEPAPVSGSVASSDASTKGASTVKEVLDTIKVPGSSEPTDKTKGASSKRGAGASDEKSDIPLSSPKVPDSVKKVVNSLNDATDGVTLENLNSAREAVVKLDVLIDIEKRLNDLSKLRKTRQGESDAFADALPHSAFQPPAIDLSQSAPPPSLIPQPSQGINHAQMIMPSTNIEVVRVSGASGHYSAQVKDVDGTTKSVRAGDKLADGSTINSISRDGVTVSTFDKKTKTIPVKDVGTVFSSR